MPGLMDVHVHLFAQNVRTSKNYRVDMFEVAPELQMLYAMLHAQMCFEMGFTTVRDLGWISPSGLNVRHMVALRDGIEAGVFPGPRIVVAAWVTITGSHLDLVIPRAGFRAPDMTADGPWELRKLARQHLRTGCDVLKTCASGGGGTDKEAPEIRNMTQEELNAIADEAHAFHKKCSCHCFTPESIHMAIKAGVDTIEHCTLADDSSVAAMSEAKSIVVPTLAHRTDHAIEVRRQMGASDFVVEKMKRLQEHAFASFQKIHRAGIKVAMGSDTQMDPEMGSNALELGLYVTLGMTPMEALRTATINAAEAIGMEADLGTIEVGKLADIVAVKGRPDEDIEVLQKKELIQLVMKEGHIFIDRREGSSRGVIHTPRYA